MEANWRKRILRSVYLTYVGPDAVLESNRHTNIGSSDTPNKKKKQIHSTSRTRSHQSLPSRAWGRALFRTYPLSRNREKNMQTCRRHIGNHENDMHRTCSCTITARISRLGNNSLCSRIMWFKVMFSGKQLRTRSYIL